MNNQVMRKLPSANGTRGNGNGRNVDAETSTLHNNRGFFFQLAGEFPGRAKNTNWPLR